MEHQQTISETLTGLTHGIKRLGILYFEKARLKTTEKITILLATIAFSAVIMALGLVFLVFVSIGVGHYLATSIAPHLAYLIIAAFYLLLFVLALALRRRLFVDPIARFMSRLLVEEPEELRAERLMDTEAANAPDDDVDSDENEHPQTDTASQPDPEPTPSPTDGSVSVDVDNTPEQPTSVSESYDQVIEIVGGQRVNRKGGDDL